MKVRTAVLLTTLALQLVALPIAQGQERPNQMPREPADAALTVSDLPPGFSLGGSDTRAFDELDAVAHFATFNRDQPGNRAVVRSVLVIEREGRHFRSEAIQEFVDAMFEMIESARAIDGPTIGSESRWFAATLWGGDAMMVGFVQGSSMGVVVLATAPGQPDQAEVARLARILAARLGTSGTGDPWINGPGDGDAFPSVLARLVALTRYGA